jgi:quercetin dioxygenase-like cupin family protein
MSHPFDRPPASPPAMTLRCAGDGVCPVPEGVSSASFLVQMRLTSRTAGEMTMMRACLPPGAATHRHSHPRGQRLFLLEGAGIVQGDGDDPADVRAGDAIGSAPGERPWHGAAPDSPFRCVSVQAVKEGTAVHWMEPLEPAGGRLP